MIERKFVKIDSLDTIGICLEQLAIAEESIIAIEIQIDSIGDTDPEWRKRADKARRTVGHKKRIVMARLAVLRQQEKERNVQLHQRHNDYLVKELHRIVSPSAFANCVIRATDRMNAEDK